MEAGKLDRRVTFDSPTRDADGVQNGWLNDALTRWAHFRYLRGGEAVLAARLQGRQVVVATVRADTATGAITSEWRMKHAGTEYNIRTVVPSDDQGFYELTCESGVAV